MEDWNREAMKMASIYECAHVTLAGAPAGDESQGLFHKSIAYESAEVNDAHNTDLAPAVEVRKTLYSQRDSELLCRGWVFQELQLSRRFVHFTREEIVWECNCSEWCECTSHGEWGKKQIRWTKGSPEGTFGTHTWYYFDGIVPKFSQMQLTKVEDRLPALAGLASRYAHIHSNLTYVAGLWLEELTTTGLFWGNVDEGVLVRPEPLFAPTWSWASVGASVKFRSDSSRRLGLKRLLVRGYHLTPVQGGNQYGHLLEASLHLSGFVISGKLTSYDSAADTHRHYGYSPPLSTTSIDGVRKTVYFKSDYDLRAETKHKVALGSRIFFLFGYVNRHTTEDGSTCGSSSTEDEDDAKEENDGKAPSPLWDGRLHAAHCPGGLVVRCIDEKANHFERIGLFDASVCAWANDMAWEIGHVYRECLKEATWTDLTLV